jgi:hypothetical protein
MAIGSPPQETDEESVGSILEHGVRDGFGLPAPEFSQTFGHSPLVKSSSSGRAANVIKFSP